MVNCSVAERQILRDAIDIGGMHHGGLAEVAAALGIFGLGQVAASGAMAQDFAGAGDLEPFGNGLSSFDAFGTSHNNSVVKKDTHLTRSPPVKQA
jgi:hypothetical protein